MNGAAAARRLAGWNLPSWTLPVAGSLVTGVLWIALGPVWVLLGLVGTVLLGIALASYAWTLGIVLVGRTCMDLVWDKTLYLGAMRVSAASIFSLVILGLLVLTFLASGSAVPRSSGIKALGLLFIGSALAAATAFAHFGEAGGMAFRELVRLLLLLAWYAFLYERTCRTGEARPFMRAVLLAAVLPIVVGIWDVVGGIGIPAAGINRIYSTFVDSNAFGFYLVFLIMFCFAWLSQEGKVLPWLLLGISLLLLLLTYSRGAWITMMIAAPLFWLRASRRRVLVMLVFAVLLVIAYPVLNERLASVDYSDILTESRTEVTSNSYSFRVLIWKRLLELWMEKPSLGWGLESTSLINPILSMEGKGAAAHNDGVRYLVEGGIVGLAFYASFLWILGRVIYRRARDLRGHPLEAYATATFVTYVAFVVQSLTVAEPLHQTIFLFHFLGLVAVLEGCAEFRRISGSQGDSSVEALEVAGAKPPFAFAHERQA